MKSSNNDGLTNKYIIQKSDGTPVDPDAKYFVLRYDGKDEYSKASRFALHTYSKLIFDTNKKLAVELAVDLGKEASLARDVQFIINCLEEIEQKTGMTLDLHLIVDEHQNKQE